MNVNPKRPIRITAVEPLDGFAARLQFSDGTEKVLDLDRYLNGPIFEPLRREAALFRSVTVDADLGTIVWPNGADLDPDVLYFDRIPAEEEDTAEIGRQHTGRTMPW